MTFLFKRLNKSLFIRSCFYISVFPDSKTSGPALSWLYIKNKSTVNAFGTEKWVRKVSPVSLTPLSMPLKCWLSFEKTGRERMCEETQLTRMSSETGLTRMNLPIKESVRRPEGESAFHQERARANTWKVLMSCAGVALYQAIWLRQVRCFFVKAWK